MKKQNVLIVGGTDGIGAALALALYRQGARVIVIGRSKEKARRLHELSQSADSEGSLEVIVSDLSLMHNVKDAVNTVKSKTSSLDVIIHTVGILITKTEHTEEGIEKDFAVSYLARFACTEELHAQELLHNGSLMVNVAASAPKVPTYARMEFDNINEVQSRVGMVSHGQAQLANDIFTALAPRRYGITTIGYGPGSVNTNIRRELPKLLVSLVQPFFYFSTREPQEVAQQIVDILNSPNLQHGQAQFFNKNGAFPVDTFIADTKRQNALLTTSLALLKTALASYSTAKHF